MRKTLMLVGIPIAVAGVAVAVARYAPGTKPNDKFATDLQQAQVAGLDLAQSQGGTRYALTEITPESRPAPAMAVKKGNGTKSIRSKAPTVKAAPKPVDAQLVETAPEAQVIQTAATPTSAEVTAPAVPRPVPQTTQSSGSDQGPILAGGVGRGTGRTTDGGSGWGGIFGAIIRGGVVDGDHCDPRPVGGMRRPERPIYGGNPNGMGGLRMPYPSTGTSRMPVMPTGVVFGGRHR